MRIISSVTGFFGSHMYFVIEGSDAVVVDPADAEIVSRVINEEKITVSYIFLTHEHCDHSYGCKEIRDKYQCKICSSNACDKNLKDERRNQSRYFEAFANVQTRFWHEEIKEIAPFSAELDITFDEELRLSWRGHDFYLRETPGHSEGSVCILLDNSYLFSGDSLLWGELVNTRFPGGSKTKFENDSLPWLESLDPNIHVYPGHLEQFRLGDRLKYPIL